MRPVVYLIGTGPGDPGLITVRGLRALATADVVLYDHLVPSRMLRYARQDAEKIDVGSAAPQPLDQEAILREAGKPARLVVVAENHTIIGGLGEAVAALLMRSGIHPAFRQIALPDEFLAAGALPTLHDRYGISTAEVARQIKGWLR